MHSPFSFSKHVGAATTATWTLGWLLGAGCAAQYWNSSQNSLPLIVTGTVAALGSCLTVRTLSREGKSDTANASEAKIESWGRRLSGGLAVVAWSAFALIWNFGVFGSIARSAFDGNVLGIVILIPFSLIGFFLLTMLFTSIALVLDSLLHLEARTPSPEVSELAAEPPIPIAPPPQMPADDSDTFRKAPILTGLFLLSFLNWFVFFAVSMWLHGDALGTLPSRDGFIVTSHGRHAAVSEGAWLFSLYYSAATLLVTPAVWLIFGVRSFWMQRPGQKVKWSMKIFLALFLIVWFVGWYSSIGSSFLRSHADWQKMKRPAAKQSQP